MAGTVFVAEPNPELRLSISASLRAEGFGVEAVGTLSELPTVWRGVGPDVLLLAGELAENRTRALLETFRSQGWVGALLLVGRPRVGDETSLSAEGTLPRPLILQDLIAWLKAQLGIDPALQSRILRLNGCVIDLGRQTVSAVDGIRRLTTKEAEFLSYLAHHPGRTVGRDELLKRVWGYVAGGSGRVVDKMLTRVRAKIGDDANSPQHIFTVYGGGYRFEPLPAQSLSSGSIPAVTPEAIAARDRAAALTRAASPAIAEALARSATTPALPAAAQRTNLVSDGTSFVGRQDDLLDLAEDLRGGARLVTILGPGGAGKTRLARHFGAYFLAEQRPSGGVWFIDLTDARDLSDLLAALCGAIDLHPDRADDGDDPVTSLGHALAELGEVLLILDNFEQLVAPAADTIAAWLDLAPHARFLVTAREPLRLGWERCFELEPLSEDDAAALFIERAQAARRGFTPTAETLARIREIVARVDHLPLPIELAAARVTSLSVDQIAQRLGDRMGDLLRSTRRDLSPRQATLWGAVDWSWELLVRWEQEALCQCSVFRGGFFLDAAESVLDLSLFPEAPPVLDAVEELVRKSLLRRSEVPGLENEVRFGMYEVIRDYAAGRLAERPDSQDQTMARHRAFVLSVGDELARAARSGARNDALRRLMLEQDNLVAVLRRSRGNDPRSAVDAALALDALFAARGPVAAWRGVLDQALEAARSLGAAERARVLHARGRARQASDPYVAAETDLLGALALAREAGSDLLLGAISLSLGNLRSRQGLWASAVEHYTLALEAIRRAGDRPEEARVLARLGAALQQQGHVRRAVLRYREAMRIRSELSLGSPHALADGSLFVLDLGAHGESASMHAGSQVSMLAGGFAGEPMSGFASLAHLWGAAMPEGTAQEVDEALLEAREHARQSGDLLAEAMLLASRGVARLDAHRLDEAATLFRAALDVFQRVGHQPAEGSVLGQLGRVSYLVGDLDEAEELFERSGVLLRQAGDRRARAYVLAHLAALQADSGRPELAARTIERAHGLVERVGDPLAARLVAVAACQVRLGAARAAEDAGEVGAVVPAAAHARAMLAELSAATASVDLRIATHLLRQALKTPLEG